MREDKRVRNMYDQNPDNLELYQQFEAHGKFIFERM